MATSAEVGYLSYGAPTRNPFNYAKIEQIDRDIDTPWLTLEEITQQLNLFGDESQDTYLTSLELATRFAIEDYLGMSIFAASYRVWYNLASLYGTPLALDLPAVSQNTNPSVSGVTVNSVKYWNTDSIPELITVDPETYYYDSSGNKVILTTLPNSINTSITSPVFCQYTTAANPLSTYPVIKQAALLLLTHLYNNRSETTDGQLKNIPFGVSTLLRSYKPLVM